MADEYEVNYGIYRAFSANWFNLYATMVEANISSNKVNEILLRQFSSLG